MNLPLSELKIFILISIFVIPGIAGIFFTFETLSSSKEIPSAYGTYGENLSQQNPKIIDTEYEIQEWNLSFVHNMTIVHVTYDEIKDFPDIEQSMHDENNHPRPWNYGHRVMRSFEGNMSDSYRFNIAVCKGKTPFECFSPNPPIFEYHGQYYTISTDMFRPPSPD